MSQKIEEILNKGVEEIIDREHLESELKSSKILRVKFGIDPTSPDLHLGHSIALRKLRQFQDLGHKVILLIGDFTATIGDPSGRSTTRPILSEKDIKKNMKDYIKQAGKILNIRKTEIRYNSEWYKRKGAAFLMELSSKFTVARMLERDDFQKRLKEDVDISILEILYPILQGYDSVELKADVEIGGRDQKFNLLMGRKVQKRYDLPEQDIITMPLLEGTDGVKKMSKSLGNYIGLTEAPDSMFGKIMSIPDELMDKYFNLLTNLSKEELGNLSPRDLKAKLAKEIVKNFHSEKESNLAEEKFNKIHRDGQMPTEMEIFEAGKKNYHILDLLCDTNLAPSKNEAKRLVEGGAVSKRIGQDDVKIIDWKEEVILENEMVLQVGKRKFIKIILK